jgi:hypothetical protein
MAEADAEQQCPQCGVTKVQRQYSTFAASVTGGGGEAMGCAKPGCGARAGFS